MDHQKVPKKMWDFGLNYTSHIHSFTAHSNLDNRTPCEILTGEMPDMSNYLYFDFYQWIKYYEPASFPSGCEKLGHSLGPVHDVGQAVCYWIIKENGQVIARSSV